MGSGRGDAGDAVVGHHMGWTDMGVVAKVEASEMSEMSLRCGRTLPSRSVVTLHSFITISMMHSHDRAAPLIDSYNFTLLEPPSPLSP